MDMLEEKTKLSEASRSAYMRLSLIAEGMVKDKIITKAEKEAYLIRFICELRIADINDALKDDKIDNRTKARYIGEKKKLEEERAKAVKETKHDRQFAQRQNQMEQKKKKSTGKK